MTSCEIFTFWGSLLSSFAEPYHMPFCHQFRPLVDFSVWFCPNLGCVDLCKVTLLCRWIIYSSLSAPQRTTRGLIANSKSLLIFSTSSVSRLWVCSCLERFFCLAPFGLMWSFLWSSSRVLVLLVSICSFLVLVCREWRWISWTKNHVFHHGLAFSSLISFLVTFCVNRCVFSLSGLLWVLLVLLSYCLSIQPFRYVLVAIC